MLVRVKDTFLMKLRFSYSPAFGRKWRGWCLIVGHGRMLLGRCFDCGAGLTDETKGWIYKEKT